MINKSNKKKTTQSRKKCITTTGLEDMVFLKNKMQEISKTIEGIVGHYSFYGVYQKFHNEEKIKRRVSHSPYDIRYYIYQNK